MCSLHNLWQSSQNLLFLESWIQIIREIWIAWAIFFAERKTCTWKWWVKWEDDSEAYYIFPELENRYCLIALMNMAFGHFTQLADSWFCFGMTTLETQVSYFSFLEIALISFPLAMLLRYVIKWYFFLRYFVQHIM